MKSESGEGSYLSEENEPVDPSYESDEDILKDLLEPFETGMVEKKMSTLKEGSLKIKSLVLGSEKYGMNIYHGHMSNEDVDIWELDPKCIKLPQLFISSEFNSRYVMKPIDILTSHPIKGSRLDSEVKKTIYLIFKKHYNESKVLSNYLESKRLGLTEKKKICLQVIQGLHDLEHCCFRPTTVCSGDFLLCEKGHFEFYCLEKLKVISARHDILPPDYCLPPEALGSHNYRGEYEKYFNQDVRRNNVYMWQVIMLLLNILSGKQLFEKGRVHEGMIEYLKNKKQIDRKLFDDDETILFVNRILKLDIDQRPQSVDEIIRDRFFNDVRADVSRGKKIVFCHKHDHIMHGHLKKFYHKIVKYNDILFERLKELDKKHSLVASLIVFNHFSKKFEKIIKQDMVDDDEVDIIAITSIYFGNKLYTKFEMDFINHFSKFLRKDSDWLSNFFVDSICEIGVKNLYCENELLHYRENPNISNEMNNKNLLSELEKIINHYV